MFRQKNSKYQNNQQFQIQYNQNDALQIPNAKQKDPISPIFPPKNQMNELRLPSNNLSSFSYSRDSRSRSHSRDPTPINKQLQMQRNIEQKNQMDDLYYKQSPYVPQRQNPEYSPYMDPYSNSKQNNPYQEPRNPFHQPFAYENERKRSSGMNDNEMYPVNYEYEKRVTANFSRSPSRPVYQDEYSDNRMRGYNNGNPNPAFYEKPKMLYDSRNEQNLMSSLRRSRDPNSFDYPQTGFEKLFIANTITMKPYFFPHSGYGSSDIYDLCYNIYPGEVTRGRNISEPPLFTFMYKHGFCSKYCAT